jgi:hypothetical protein
MGNDTQAPRFHHFTPFDWLCTNATDRATLRARNYCNPGSILEVDDGDQIFCEYSETPGEPSSEVPQELYYGFDLYGTKNEIEEFNNDLSPTYSNSNGQDAALLYMSEDIAENNSWDTCVCFKTQNTWIATGSVQMSWNGVYNGYSQCWTPNCDNDASIN